MFTSSQHTNGANDAGPAVVPLGSVLRVQVGLPFQLGTVAEMKESVTHFACVCEVLFLDCFLS